jgi:glycine/D-amino acid oxidase-like deaminating enzyme
MCAPRGGHRIAFVDVAERRTRARSLWLDVLPESLVPRPRLEGAVECDVAIVGAGFVGLWTAYRLARADPTLRIRVLEAEVAGFGAAGRNAGFASAGIAGEARVYERRVGADGVRRAERAMIDAIDAIGAVVAREAIDCGWVKSGALRVATSPAQLERVRAGLDARRARGLGEEDVRLVGADEIATRVRIRGALGGTYTPHCARINPAALARGLATACERLGVVVHERTPVSALAPGRVVAASGTVRAEVVLRATEAFTIRLPGERRRFLPVYSHMLATEPLPASAWDEIGWAGCEPVADQRYVFRYGQRTPDGRIALGGGGATYGFGSRLDERREGDADALRRVEQTLRTWFPTLAGVEITHRWGGAFATPRDWSMGVGYDRTTGLGWAGGLAGHGVVASSLCGRALADLVLGRETEHTSLPWVGHESPRWEPEPLRWLAARAIPRILRSADEVEDRGLPRARRARLVARFTPGR